MNPNRTSRLIGMQIRGALLGSERCTKSHGSVIQNAYQPSQSAASVASAYGNLTQGNSPSAQHTIRELMSSARRCSVRFD